MDIKKEYIPTKRVDFLASIDEAVYKLDEINDNELDLRFALISDLTMETKYSGLSKVEIKFRTELLDKAKKSLWKRREALSIYNDIEEMYSSLVSLSEHFTEAISKMNTLIDNNNRLYADFKKETNGAKVLALKMTNGRKKRVESMYKNFEARQKELQKELRKTEEKVKKIKL